MAEEVNSVRVLLYDDEAAGRALSMSASSVKKLRLAGKLKSVKINSMPRIHWKDLENFVNRLRVPADEDQLLA